MTVSAAVPAAMRGDVSVMAPGGQVAGADEIVARAREERLMATLEAQTRLLSEANTMGAYHSALADYNARLASNHSTQNAGCFMAVLGFFLIWVPFVGLGLIGFGLLAAVLSALTTPRKPRRP